MWRSKPRGAHAEALCQGHLLSGEEPKTGMERVEGTTGRRVTARRGGWRRGKRATPAADGAMVAFTVGREGRQEPAGFQGGHRLRVALAVMWERVVRRPQPHFSVMNIWASLKKQVPAGG